MKKNLIFTLLIGLTCIARPETEIKLLSREPIHLQKVANLLIFLSKPTSISFDIMQEAQDHGDDIKQAKHDALKIIQKAVGPFLDKTITTTHIAYTKKQMDLLNGCYKQILIKLPSKKHRKFLYGDRAGKSLPSSIDFNNQLIHRS
jgi:hypothetical protein